MEAQQSGSAEDMAALSGLTLALQSIDWKNQYVWSYAWEAIEDVDVNLASEGNSYYDPGIYSLYIMYFFLPTTPKIAECASVSNKWIQEKSPNHTPSGSSRGSRVSTAEADEPTKRGVDMFEFHDEAENIGIRADIEGFRDEK